MCKYHSLFKLTVDKIIAHPFPKIKKIQIVNSVIVNRKVRIIVKKKIHIFK